MHNCKPDPGGRPLLRNFDRSKSTYLVVHTLNAFNEFKLF